MLVFQVTIEDVRDCLNGFSVDTVSLIIQSCISQRMYFDFLKTYFLLLEPQKKCELQLKEYIIRSKCFGSDCIWVQPVQPNRANTLAYLWVGHQTIIGRFNLFFLNLRVNSTSFVHIYFFHVQR